MLSAVFGFDRFDNVSLGVVDVGFVDVGFVEADFVEADFVDEAVGLADIAVDCDEATVRAGALDDFAPATGEAAVFDATVLSVGMTGFVFATDFEDLLVVFAVVDFPVVDFLLEVLPLNQPTIPVGAGFDPFAAGCSAIAFSAQMTPIISATRHLRSIRAPSMESADRPVFRIGGRFQ